ncbi:MAG: carboxypeptidase-like regulatory domain-containing protein, partial [Ginsengibacter sp.]
MLILRITSAILSFILFSGIIISNASAQQVYTIRGVVYDSSRTYPLPGVSVLSSSGRGTSTNSSGYYEINVPEKDSIWFSYLNKPTVKFPVLKIRTPLQFDIAIDINIPVLREVKIRPPDYRLDSIRNREEYAKIFDFQKPKI